MTFVVVPNLLEGRDQLNKRFPNRDKSSEGTIGDIAHQSTSSSHNPDESGNPEFSDHDNVDEVRAADFDKDLRATDGTTMEQVVQLWITKARSGEMWWVRYFIYNKRIWHKGDGYKTRVYTGSNPHTDHVHVNSDFTQKADIVTGTNWHLDEVNKPTSPTAPTPHIVKKGDKGVEVGWIQEFLRYNFAAYRHVVRVDRGSLLVVDRDFGPQTEAWVKEFQSRTGLTEDGIVGPKTFAMMRRYGYKH